MRVNHNLRDLQKRDSPINYSNVSVNQLGKLEKRKSLLDERIVEGYGVIWGSVNDRGEKFIKGSFAKSIADLGPGTNSSYQIKFRDEHGRACSLFQELKEDEIGLYFKTVPLDAVQWSDDMLVQLKSGTINNFSIGFKHVWDKIEWDEEEDCMVNLEAKLFEISAVSIPSDITTYAVRAAEEIEYLTEDVEEFIITLPRSKQLEARKIITRCMSLTQNEPPVQIRKALKDEKKPTETGLDINYLISKL